MPTHHPSGKWDWDGMQKQTQSMIEGASNPTLNLVDSLMLLEDAKKLSHGLYRIFWKSGGSSLASVGCLHDGTPWFAPTNWTSKDQRGVAVTAWRMVERVENLSKSEQRYTLAEIDRMREAVLRKNVEMRPQNFGVGPEGAEPWAKRAFEAWRTTSEEELRTYLIGGVTPEELDTLFPPK